MATESSQQQETDDAADTKEIHKPSYEKVDELPAVIAIPGDECEEPLETTVDYQSGDDLGTVTIQSKSPQNPLVTFASGVLLLAFIGGVSALMMGKVAEGGLFFGIIGGLTVTVMDAIVDLRGRLEKRFR